MASGGTTTVWLQLPAGVSNGIALAQTPAAAGALILNGSLVTAGVANLTGGVKGSGLPAQRVGIHSSANDATVVFTLTGTGRNGQAQSETITGVNADTVDSALDYATVTGISSSAGTAGSITAGTVGVGSTDWIVPDTFVTPFELALAASIAAGAANYTVERTYDDPNRTGVSLVPTPQQFSIAPNCYIPPLVWPVPELTAQTGNAEAEMSARPVFAYRLTINSGTGQVVLQSIQAGSPRV
jgi:hypothetical protein